MPRHRIKAIILIAIGSLFLLDNLGIPGIDAGELIQRWWPLAPILIGIGLLFGCGKPSRASPRD